MKLAVIGDVHHAWTEVDTAFFNASDYDALLFVGDIYNFSLQRGLRAASELAQLDKPALLIPGNHDAIHPAQLAAEITRSPSLIRWTSMGHTNRVRMLSEAVGGVEVGGYSIHPLGDGIDVICARPHSMGGSAISFAPHLAEAYGVYTLEDSIRRLKRCVDESEAQRVIFLAHNGPTGVGDRRTDLWGADFRREEGDFGDYDLRVAIDYAIERGKWVSAVVAGHMHHRLRGGGVRSWSTYSHGVLYINAARVPRIFEERDGVFHHHVDLLIDGKQSYAVEVLRRGEE
ncbi:MAG: putative transcripton factor for heterocyst differentiation DevT [Myxococcaceae bacterium]|nr:putative transcripton factor for heterocyst differentiation DevT [Myxococcaceae bacterium]